MTQHERIDVAIQTLDANTPVSLLKARFENMTTDQVGEVIDSLLEDRCRFCFTPGNPHCQCWNDE